MTVTPHDIGTFLVSSRTLEEVEYIVDLSDPENPMCGCPAMLDFKTCDSNAPCAHLEAAIAFRNGQKIERRKGGSPSAMLNCRVEDF